MFDNVTEGMAIALAISFVSGLAAGTWLGFKLWRETYVRGVDGNTIGNVRWH